MSQHRPVYVIGHRNPDTDSICSAISYAYYKQVTDMPYAQPACLGRINAETQFVLDYFQVNAPLLLPDIYPKVKDIMETYIITASLHQSLYDLAQMMQQNHLKAIPIVEHNNLVGMVSMGDLARYFLNNLQNKLYVSLIGSVSHITHVLQGKILSDSSNYHIHGQVHLATGNLERISMHLVPDSILIITDYPPAQQFAIEKNVSVIILAQDTPIDDQMLQQAQQKKILIIQTPFTDHQCINIIQQYILAKDLMQTEIHLFKPDDLITDIRPIMAKTNFRLYPVVQDHRLVGLVRRGKLIVQERTKVILVDHNEPTQSIEGIEEADIIEIIDHHRLGGLSTNKPIFIRHDPVGCTATIIAHMFWQRNIDIPPTIAGLLLSAILSDTVIFKSPTCTEKDISAAQELATAINLDIPSFGQAMIQAGTSLKGKSPEDLITSDLKEFYINDHLISISQFSIVDDQELQNIIPQLHEALSLLKKHKKYKLSLLIATDISREGSYLLASPGYSHVLKQAFGIDGDYGFLPGVISRKKQIVPPLVENFHQLAI
jgi:manganese-dependent inorganic pyrophosphatase